MTDEELIARLRDGDLGYGEAAADRIEALVKRLDAVKDKAEAYIIDLVAERDRVEARAERLEAAVAILEDALQEAGDDYPGSSMQQWCQHQVKAARAALKGNNHD